MLLQLVIASKDSTLGTSNTNPASSCNEIYQRNPTSRGGIGKYWVKTTEGLSEVTCNMQLKCGGVEGGWMQVVDVDMNQDNSCPGTWHKIITPKRLCLGYSIGCIPANFDVKGVSYEHICGQAKAYQKEIRMLFTKDFLQLMAHMLMVFPLLWDHHAWMDLCCRL